MDMLYVYHLLEMNVNLNQFQFFIPCNRVLFSVSILDPSIRERPWSTETECHDRSRREAVS